MVPTRLLVQPPPKVEVGELCTAVDKGVEEDGDVELAFWLPPRVWADFLADPSAGRDGVVGGAMADDVC